MLVTLCPELSTMHTVLINQIPIPNHVTGSQYKLFRMKNYNTKIYLGVKRDFFIIRPYE